MLILAFFVLFFLLNMNEKYQNYSEFHSNRAYLKSNLKGQQDLFYPDKYYWNYGPGYYSKSNLGEVSVNYKPDFIPYGVY